MKRNTKIALLLGAVVVMGSGGIALAHMDGPRPPDGPMQGLLHRERLADRLLQEYDTNHDGKITRAEYNNVLGTRFNNAARGGKTVTPEQFATMHQGDFQKHAAAMFKRIDWNGDGKLSLDEFAAPQRARFQMMDREGSGSVACGATPADYRADGPPQGDRGWGRGRGWGGFAGGHRGRRGFGGFGKARFCGESDVGRDGTVTRAEFDAGLTKKFQTATSGAPAMTQAQFTADMAVRFREMTDRMFQRLDKDDDGTLTLAEYAAPQIKLFDKMDRNHDGTIGADEMKPRFRGGRGDRGGWGRGGDHRPPPPPPGEDE